MCQYAGVQEDLEPGDHLDRGHRRRPCQLQHLHLDQVRTSSLKKHLFNLNFKVTNFFIVFRKGQDSGGWTKKNSVYMLNVDFC